MPSTRPHATDGRPHHDAVDAGPLALVGGDEFKPGNEPHDRQLVEAAGRLPSDRPAFVIATAAARGHPEQAVATARDWFEGLGLEVEELPLRRRSQATDSAIAELARTGRFFYICGGDPGLVPQVLGGSAAWDAILEAWSSGAPLAGSSAGAMALGEWTLIRARMPGDARRQPRAALGVVPRIAVLPHYETFGRHWLPSAREALDGEGATLVGIDERSAAVWSHGVWRAMGSGSVTVFAAGASSSLHPEEQTALPIPQPARFGQA
jgi:cyanophycinase